MDKNILWRCRRGTKELDLLLEHYYKKNYISMSASQIQLFTDLLSESDDNLMAWFINGIEPNVKYQKLINAIKSSYN